MINSRDPKELLPFVQSKAEMLLLAAKERGIDLIITSTYRDFESQDALYAKGRTEVGSVVTNAKGGDSYHNYRMAFDVVPVIGGKAIWDDMKLWHSVGSIGKSCGLQWGGDWSKFRDLPHFQDTHGLTLADLKQRYPQGIVKDES